MIWTDKARIGKNGRNDCACTREEEGPKGV